MPNEADGNTITVLLEKWRSGDKDAGDSLVGLVYDELHRIAAREMRRERRDHTLQTTALLHEAYLRIVRAEPIDWQNRAHFYAVAAQQLRRVLLDYARRVSSEKRGGDVVKLPLWDSDAGSLSLDERLLAVDQALVRLEALAPRAAKVIELRYFGGLTESDAAEALHISVTTLKRDWEFAKTWLTAQLT
jgi:RNA polymerase sigma factor (TIGR02999 family)